MRKLASIQTVNAVEPVLPGGATLDEGTDVTEQLGVLKWEPPVPVGRVWPL